MSNGAEFTAVRLTALSASGLLTEADIEHHDRVVEMLRRTAVRRAATGELGAALHISVVKKLSRGTYNLLVNTLSKKGFRVGGSFRLSVLHIYWGTV